MVEIFKALSEETRLRILSILINQELCVCEIESILNLTQSNVSRHLLVLKSCGLLSSYKKAQWTYYSISELFKAEHYLLWEYLKQEVRKLSTYADDVKAAQKCKGLDLCNR